ncbi:MAG: domain S-box, partial [Armatimonadetes bacterium]|nr:domain S-box [Armatimonadota bacterium]
MSEPTRLEQQQALLIHDLRLRLEEAEEILSALRRGEVDALVVKPGETPQIWSLNGVEEIYRVLFETLNEGALTVGEDGTILYSNHRFAELAGEPLKKVLGAPFAQFVTPSDREVFEMLLSKGLARSSKGELRLLRPDGSQVPVQTSFNAVLIEPIGTTCTIVISDLSELKKVQAALAEANEHLEARVERRTAELSAEVAERKRLAEELEQANRRKNEFLAMLGHELRNPLAPIMNSVEMIRLREGQSPEVDRARVVIERQIRHMARLVDDLLDVSRITRGLVELRRERVDFTAVVESALNSCRSMFEVAQHQLSVSLPGEPCWLEGDGTRLEQVVVNLISNAAKYTPPHGRVSVSLERHDDMAELCVRDNGRGIPPEMLPRIFELFTQVDTTIDRSLGGLGIGLTVVRNLVEL